MSPRLRDRSLLALAAAACLAPRAPAAPPPDPAETFLREHHLDAMLESYLHDRLDHAAPPERRALADRLGRYYVERLATVTDAAERDRLLDAATELLAAANADEALELRVGLAIARFRPAEETAERAVLLLATPEEIAAATASLETASLELDRLGRQLEREVLADERVKRANADAPEPDSRRQLSLAKYYAGWAYLHLARLAADPADAQRALEQFAWVLDTPNEEPSIERLPRSLLRLDHVARAAIGVALAKHTLARDVEAEAWLDALADADLSDAVAQQVFVRRIDVLPASGHFSQLALHVQAWQAAHPGPLTETQARLLAIRSLDASRDAALPAGAHAAAGRLAELALSDLIERNALAQVLDLVRKFGDLPMRDAGFVTRYVRGAALFDRARLAHQHAPRPQLPTDDTDVRALYDAARDQLAASLDAPDAADHPDHRAAAAMLAARCDYFAGRFADAADAFLAAERLAINAQGAEDALWMAVVCLDTLAAQDPGSTPHARDLAARFLAEYPASPRAPALLLRTLDADLVSPDQAIEVLRSVPDDDPIATTARRQLARMLYARVRQAPPAERRAAAQAFLDVAHKLLDPVLASTRPESLTADPEADALLRLRQMLDVALLPDPPLVGEAERALQIADRVPLSTDPAIAAELRLRRIQLALIRHDDAAADTAFEQYPPDETRFRPVALELLFADAARRWSEREHTAPSARRVIRFGSLMLAGTTADAPAPPALADPVADAAGWLWRTTADTAMRDAAITLDERALRADRATGASLARLAAFAESADRAPLALAAWLAIMASNPPGSPAWFEARYHSLVLLAPTDPAAARAALDQTRALYPSLGGDDWAPKFAALDASLPPADQTPEPAP